MVQHHDAPFADAANIPLYLMSAQVAARTKVVLQGDGGDELFGGYRRYATLKYYRLLHPLARALQSLERALRDPALHYRAQRYLHALAAPDLAATMALLLTFEDRHAHPEQVFARDFAQALSRYRSVRALSRAHPAFAGHSIGNQMSLMDLSIVLPDIYLEKVDRSTMAASLEVRVPFLDHDLVDYVVGSSGEPTRCLMAGRNGC